MWSDSFIVLSESTTTQSRHLILIGLAFLKSFELFLRNLSTLLIIRLFLMLTHIQRLVIPPSKFLLRFEFILDGLIHPGATWCSLNVDSIQIAHIGLVKCYPILKGVAFWRFQDAFSCNLWMIKMIREMLSPIINEVLLPCRDFRRKVLRFTIIPSPIG